MNISVSLKSTSIDYIDIFWETEDMYSSSLDYTYEVLRGESPAGPFEVIADSLVDRFHIRDYIAPRKRAWRNLYYKVVATHSTGAKHESEATNLSARPPFDALEMIRLNSLLFREFSGRPVLIYSVRTFGEKCSNCYDKVTGRQLIGNCKNCYGTTYSRGYHYPVYAYVNLSPEQKTQQATDSIVTQQAQIQGRMSIYPLLKVGDIMVEQEGTRWRVQSVSLTERLRSPVQQMFVVARIPEGDIEYSIPVNWDDTVKTSPRSFNPRTTI